ncbi:alpha/beta fold hydrolase [Agarivorans sp. Alg241-V36]|uniref:alpha/beta fold hydrolase n=1 Tax=Agarivorans sp. Alg241-V36 TaxID=2305992 RepID=UPI0013D851B3|nr:alpha/beta hydrolase [Agarivorans sp. Alg241-V36]
MSKLQRPIVLIRGLVREQRHWGDFSKLLQQAFPERLILSFDTPGNGLLCHLTSADTIADMRQSLRIQLKLTNANIDSVDIVAISLGGMLAVDWATHFSLEVNSLVLINSSNAQFSPFYKRLNWRIYPYLLSAVCSSSSSDRQSKILRLTSNFPLKHQPVLDFWLKWAEQCPVSLKNAYLQLKAAAAFKAANKPKQALLVLNSRRDKLVDASCSTDLARHWQADLKQHPTAGHDLPLDAPRWTVRQIQRWLSELSC